MNESDTDAEDGAVAELRDVTRSYGGIPVLESVSLMIRPGVTAVIGPNGSGKSTLLGTLTGEVEPVDGTVRYTGPDVPRPVGFLPQRVPFRGSFTARETLAFYTRLVGEGPDEYLAAVGLSDAGDRRVEALSGGMRRLLGIAQATVGDPPIVVLDEPTSGLDPGMRERAFEVAAGQATAGSSTVNDSSGTAVVVSSHDLDLVDEHADGIVLLHRGRVAAAGGRVELLDEHDVDDVAALYRTIIHDGTGGEEGVDESGRVHVAGVSER